jgi:hypothetical protein
MRLSTSCTTSGLYPRHLPATLSTPSMAFCSRCHTTFTRSCFRCTRVCTSACSYSSTSGQYPFTTATIEYPSCCSQSSTARHTTLITICTSTTTTASTLPSGIVWAVHSRIQLSIMDTDCVYNLLNKKLRLPKASKFGILLVESFESYSSRFGVLIALCKVDCMQKSGVYERKCIVYSHHIVFIDGSSAAQLVRAAPKNREAATAGHGQRDKVAHLAKRWTLTNCGSIASRCVGPTCVSPRCLASAADRMQASR